MRMIRPMLLIQLSIYNIIQFVVQASGGRGDYLADRLATGGVGVATEHFQSLPEGEDKSKKQISGFKHVLRRWEEI